MKNWIAGFVPYIVGSALMFLAVYVFVFFH